MEARGKRRHPGRRWIWSFSEVSNLDSIKGNGWFYGLVRDQAGFRIMEIYPGLGACPAFRSHLLQRPWLALRDVLNTEKLKRKLTKGNLS